MGRAPRACAASLVQIDTIYPARERLGRLCPPIVRHAGTPMLVPMTSSLYVPGETTALETVLVDVGTGYFIEKSPDEALKFIERKMALIEQQATNVQSAAQFKQRNLSQTIDVMNRKIMEARGGGGSSGTAV